MGSFQYEQDIDILREEIDDANKKLKTGKAVSIVKSLDKNYKNIISFVSTNLENLYT